MRKGREFYSKNYDKVMEMHAKGVAVADIAKQLGMSYSAVYHWVRGLRKPEIGNINAFEKFIADSGPMSSVEIKDKFPKHNEIFHVATSRGSPVRRHMLESRFGEYATWYFLPGQEDVLKERIRELLGKYKEIRERLAKVIENKLGGGLYGRGRV